MTRAAITRYVGNWRPRPSWSERMFLPDADDWMPVTPAAVPEPSGATLRATAAMRLALVMRRLGQMRRRGEGWSPGAYSTALAGVFRGLPDPWPNIHERTGQRLHNGNVLGFVWGGVWVGIKTKRAVSRDDLARLSLLAGATGRMAVVLVGPVDPLAPACLEVAGRSVALRQVEPQRAACWGQLR